MYLYIHICANAIDRISDDNILAERERMRAYVVKINIYENFIGSTVFALIPFPFNINKYEYEITEKETT